MRTMDEQDLFSDCYELRCGSEGILEIADVLMDVADSLIELGSDRTNELARDVIDVTRQLLCAW